jgi:hypothetical protein
MRPWQRLLSGNWDRDAFNIEKAELVLPVEASRRDRRVRQPEQRDIVEDIVRREAFGLPVERTRDELQTAYVLVKYLNDTQLSFTTCSPCTDQAVGDNADERNSKAGQQAAACVGARESFVDFLS